MAGKQILVVEDNDRNMKLFRDVLQVTGYRTLEEGTEVEFEVKRGPKGLQAENVNRP